ncbi:uncharacterized protein LOC129760575, partial [Uranotaenia lowii]|uniref:uncharacterized protein LOC129760575 n=1 Tax=Uranotaenia lowii TaxID=190385 RepID=UPI002479AE26
FTAFLQDELKNEMLFVEQPKGFAGNRRKVCSLRKLMYGFKQSSRVRNNQLDQALQELGLTQSKVDTMALLPGHGREDAFRIFLQIWKKSPDYDIFKLMIDKRRILEFLEATSTELVKILTMPVNHLTPPSETYPLDIKVSSRSPEVRWTNKMNRELQICYYIATESGTDKTGYQHRLQQVWSKRNRSYAHLSNEQLLSRLRKIQTERILEESECVEKKLEAQAHKMYQLRKISYKNRKVFRNLNKTYEQLYEVYSVNRALKYVNLIVDRKFNPREEVDVLAIKRVIQVMELTIKTCRKTPILGKVLRTFLNILFPHFFLSHTNVRQHLLHCNEKRQSSNEKLLEIIVEFHRNLKIIRNLLVHVQNLQQIRAIKILMNRLCNSQCLAEIKSFYDYLAQSRTKKLGKNLEFAPFLLLETNSYLTEAVEELQAAGVFDVAEKLIYIKTLLGKEINSYGNLHDQFNSSMVLMDNIISKIKANESYDKLRHMFRSHLRVFQLDHKIHQPFLVQLRTHLSSVLLQDFKEISNENVLHRSAMMIIRMFDAMDNNVGRFDQRPVIPSPEEIEHLFSSTYSSTPVSSDSQKCDCEVVGEKIFELQRLFFNEGMTLLPMNQIDLIALEMIMAEVTCALASKLPNNSKSLSSVCPVLTGLNLKNYLLNGNIVYEVLIPTINAKTMAQNALSVIKLSKNIITEIYKRHNWDFRERLDVVASQVQFFDGLHELDGDELVEKIKDIKYVIGRDHARRGLLENLTRCKSDLVLDQILDLELGYTSELLRQIMFLTDELATTPGLKQLTNLLADPEKRIDLCYYLAALSKDEDIFEKVVLKFGYEGIDSISLAYNHGQLFVSFLEAHPDYDVNSDSNTEILHYAIKSGNTELVNLLLDQCNDINQCDGEGRSPLEVACALGNFEMIKTLTNAGARWYSNSLGQYWWLFFNYDYETLIFLKNNDLLSEKIVHSCLGLFLQYCDDAMEELVELMLSYGDYRNVYPLAAKFGRGYVLKYMIANDSSLQVNVNQLDLYKRPALHYACVTGNTEVIQILLKSCQDLNGKTSLHTAGECGNHRSVQTLLDNGAATNTKNDLCKFPIKAALDQENLSLSEKISKILVRKNKNLNILLKG